jgi:predicted ATPase/signal transduction histidine kinase/tRNA A-37 threonylcarbamoyl transferase component Bud32
MLNGFQITHKLHESAHSSIYRAVRTADARPVVLKVLDSQYPSAYEIARFRQELALLEAARGEGVIEALGLERYGHSLFLVLEDFGGASLSHTFRGQRLALDQLLALALATSAALGHVHRCGIIHKDINPSNIVWNPATGQLKLIDFGIATQLASEAPPRAGARVLEGTLPYVSPEQTGRMNRNLDYRTDFYSLGVTLYELATGALPFTSRDPLELIHCHIAAQPRPPIEIRADLPPVLSALILKLMAKSADERYQSAWGLEADLARCLAHVRAGEAPPAFELGSADVPDRLEIPHRLYGRQREIELLTERFRRAAQGQREVVVVTGYSGIGKSSLVRELHEPVAEEQAFLISGKFDLLQRGTPYSALSATFSDLVKQLLVGSEDEVAAWRASLISAMGPNGRLLTDVIPGLELLVGAQPPVEVSGPLEAQNRLSLVFRDFLRVFCRPGRPLVVFLDDLQWADPASLHLVESMLADDTLAHLLLIGAYRDNEVDATHPVALLLDALAPQGVSVTRIHLEPLGHEDVGHLLADTLRDTPEAVAPLAAHVHRKTGGNPFFIAAFLRLMHEQGLLRRDAGRAGWRWDMAAIQATPVTENVAELLGARIRRLPAALQHALRLAACVGNRFDLHTLAIVAGRSITELYGALAEATREGLIVAASEPELVSEGAEEPRFLVRAYAFIHDRTQQAAYALIAERERPAIHLDVGRLLWARLEASEREERLFELVDHLNLGRGLLHAGTEPWTPVALATQNLAAARRARQAAAYDAAWRYLEVGLELCGEAWDAHYELTLDLHWLAAEVAYCRADSERSLALIEATLARARSAVVKARLYGLAIIQHTNQARPQQALQAGSLALALLGQQFPEPGHVSAALAEELACIDALLGGRPLASLLDAPAMTSEVHQATLEILATLGPTTFIADVALFEFLAARMARITLEHGQGRQSAYGYALYALLLTKLRDYQRGYEFAALGWALSKRVNDPAIEARAGQILVGHAHHWARPLQTSDAIAVEAFRAGLQGGELQYAAFVLQVRISHHFFQGLNLARVRDEATSFLRFCRQNKNAVVSNAIEGVRMAATHLAGAADGDGDGAADMTDAAAYVARCRAEQSLFALGQYHVLECQVLYTLGRYQDALAAITAAEALRPYMTSFFVEAPLSFYYALCLLALIPGASPAQQQDHRQALAAHRQRIARWVESCPENFRHMQLLIDAELARVDGHDFAAVQCFTQAIEHAQASESSPALALAHELAARFWLGSGQTRYASAHLEDAHYAYAAWGAQRKCAQLEEQYPQLRLHVGRGRVPRGGTRATKPTTGSSSPPTTTEHIDLASVLKASQAISSEIALDKLLARLIGVVIENAGAQHGYLILRHRDELVIEAQGSVDSGVRVLHGVALPAQGAADPPGPADAPGGSQRAEPVHAPGGADAARPAAPQVSTAIVSYVLRTRETVVLHDATREGPFVRDPQVRAARPRSLMCMPLLHQGQVTGVIYLANHLSPQVFTAERVELLQLLSSQMSIALENARLYHNLHRANQELERLLFSVTHDLKEPLRAIRSFSELVAQRYQPALDDQGRDYLARIVQAGERQGHLLEAIRVIAKLRQIADPRQRVPGSDLVQDALRRLAPIVAQTRATVRVADDLPALLVDRRWATEAVYQLVHNALRFTISGQPPEIEIAPYAGSEGAGLVIRDRGPGVPAENSDQLFDLFRREVGRDVPGTGVGLTIVRQVAIKHDGNAWLRPRAGGGTEAYVTFSR